jgi:hypothetical protein
MFLDLTSPGCVFGCGLSSEETGISLMPAMTCVWVVILCDCLCKGDQRRRQVHDVPEMKAGTFRSTG